MSLDKFAEKCLPFLEKAGIKVGEYESDYIGQAVALEQERIRKFSEIAEAVEYFFTDELEYDADLLVWKKMERSDVKPNLEKSLAFYENLTDKDFTIENIEKITKEYIEQEGINTGEMLWPLRIALCGRQNSPSPFEIAGVLGKEKVLTRIEMAIKKLDI